VDARSREYSSERSLPVNLIRTLAIALVIITHVASSPSVIGTNLYYANLYYSLTRPCVPLFVMLSGALLLTPTKVNEPIRIFFRKRLSRIGLPLLFWGMVYFAWRRFANHEAITLNSIVLGFFGGAGYPYFHFWFLYMLIGLYLVTPILRVLVCYASQKILEYFIILWFVGTAVVPMLGSFTSIYVSSLFFIATGWIGYFVLGAFLRRARIRSWILFLLLLAGLIWTVVGNWSVATSAGATGLVSTIFADYLSANVILASASLFLLLCAVPIDKLGNQWQRTHRLVSRVGQDSLAIYLLHVMVLEVLGEKGLFGFNLGLATLNPILGIPLLSLLVLLVSLGIIWLLRKVPMLNRAIG
jgi:surface polysaccharide O-acyltransferase-like enzyme